MTHIELADGTNRDVEIYRCTAGDWQALYLDGVLHSQGHDVTETLLRLIGVEPIHSDAFLRGGNGGGTNRTAATVREIEEWASERDRDLELAESLMADANAKIAEAAKIKARYR